MTSHFFCIALSDLDVDDNKELCKTQLKVEKPNVSDCDFDDNNDNNNDEEEVNKKNEASYNTDISDRTTNYCDHDFDDEIKKENDISDLETDS